MKRRNGDTGRSTIGEIKRVPTTRGLRINLYVVLVVHRAANSSAAVALAAAYAAKAPRLVAIIRDSAALPEVEKNAALTAAALMGMNNIWYPYVEMTGDAELKALPA